MRKLIILFVFLFFAQPAMAQGAKSNEIEEFPLSESEQFEWEYYSLFPEETGAKAFADSFGKKGYSARLKFIEHSKKYRVVVTTVSRKHEAALLAKIVEEEASSLGGSYVHTTVGKPLSRDSASNG